MDGDGLASSCKCDCSLVGSTSLSVSKEDLTLHGRRHVMHGGLEHVDGVSDGPKDNKTRP